jgi:hypothetical protein
MGTALQTRPPTDGGSRVTQRWREALRLRLDTFVVNGAKQEEVFDAIAEIGSLRTAYDRDP